MVLFKNSQKIRLNPLFITVYGFTLAEVLITLGIIGVVAAMTIPTLMNNTQNEEMKSAFKKDVSILSSAFSLLSNDNGGTIMGYYPHSQDFKDAIKQKLSYTKDCDGTSTYGGIGNGASTEGCWHQANQSKYLTGTVITSDRAEPGLILKDGTLVVFGVENGALCNFDMTPHNGNYSRCGYINVDVNGFKKPNTYGKDMFNINILKDRLVVEGGMPVDASKVCTSTSAGTDCGYDFIYK